jgi:hypothetical protein
MIDLDLFIGLVPPATAPRYREQKKTDVVEHPWMFDHVGLLANGPPGITGLPFI